MAPPSSPGIRARSTPIAKPLIRRVREIASLAAWESLIVPMSTKAKALRPRPRPQSVAYAILSGPTQPGLYALQSPKVSILLCARCHINVGELPAVMHKLSEGYQTAHQVRLPASRHRRLKTKTALVFPLESC